MSALSKICNFETFNCFRGRRCGIINRADIKYHFSSKEIPFESENVIFCHCCSCDFSGWSSELYLLFLVFPKYFPLMCEEQLQSSALQVWEWALWAQQNFDQTPWLNSAEFKTQFQWTFPFWLSLLQLMTVSMLRWSKACVLLVLISLGKKNKRIDFFNPFYPVQND